jgi:hypothetical protein
MDGADESAPRFASIQALLSTLDYLDQKRVTPIPEYFDESWYWGNISQQDTLKKLEGTRPGSYMARYHSRGFVLTYTSVPGPVSHIFIYEPYPPYASKSAKRLRQDRMTSIPPPRRAWLSYCTDPKARYVLLEILIGIALACVLTLSISFQFGRSWLRLLAGGNVPISKRPHHARSKTHRHSSQFQCSLYC